MSRYLIVIEKAGRNYSAFCPDLPGCIASGKTKKAVEKNMTEAIEFHLEGLKEDGESVRPHALEAKFVQVQ